MISVSLLSAGSTVYAEAPSYIKSLQVFQSAGMKLAGVPMDEHGLDVDALGRLMGGGSQSEGMTAAVPSAPQTSLPPRAKATRENDAVLYTIPTNHNPTGVTMSEPRRRALIASCVANRLPIIEDCAYQDLIFDGDTPHTLKSFDETGMVITLGSASKALAPGLRIGWIVADERIVQRLADVKMQMDYGASTLSQWVFARFLSSGLYDEYMVSLRMQLRRRRDAALETLERRRPCPLERAARRFLRLAHVRRAGAHRAPVPARNRARRTAQPRRHLRFRGGQLAAPELLLHHAGGVRGRRRNPGLFGIGLDGGFGLDNVQANPPLSVSKPPAATGQGTPCGRISFSRG